MQIEQRDFAQILERYDAKGTVFYMDPPYVDYQGNGRYDPLDVERRAEMFGTIAKLKGKVLLSFDDHPEIRKRAAEHNLHTRKVSVRYTLGGNHKHQSAGELLIANYPIAA